MQDGAFPECEAESESPPLPLDETIRMRTERRAFGLNDIERLEVSPQWPIDKLRNVFGLSPIMKERLWSFAPNLGFYAITRAASCQTINSDDFFCVPIDYRYNGYWIGVVISVFVSYRLVHTEDQTLHRTRQVFMVF
jgi:hypothetical protein